MYIYKICNLYIFGDHKASCLWLTKYYQTKKSEKTMQFPSIKSPPLLGYDNNFFKTKKSSFSEVGEENNFISYLWLTTCIDCSYY